MIAPDGAGRATISSIANVTRSTASGNGYSSRLPFGIGDLVVAATKEFDQAEAVAERVGQYGDFAPGVDAGFGLERRAGADERGLELVNDDVDMHGGPMASVAPRIIPGADRALRLFQQYYRAEP